MAMTNAEKQAAWRQRREQRIKELEAEVERLCRQSVRQAAKTTRAAIQLDWDIDTDDAGVGFVYAFEEPYGLYAQQMGRHVFLAAVEG